MLEIAVEEEENCLFWSRKFNEDFIFSLTKKVLDQQMDLPQIHSLFLKASSTEEKDPPIFFDWLTPTELLYLHNPDATQKERASTAGPQNPDQRVLVLNQKFPLKNPTENLKEITKSLPFPLKIDKNPSPDFFRNTIKRLRKYITFLRRETHSEKMFLTNNGAQSENMNSTRNQQFSTESTNFGSELSSQNEELKKKVQKLIRENRNLKKSTGAVQFESILKEKTMLEKEVKKLKERTENLELECASTMHLKKELRRKEKELKEMKGLIADYKISKKLKTPMNQVTSNRYQRLNARKSKEKALKRSLDERKKMRGNRYRSGEKMPGFRKGVGRSRSKPNLGVRRGGVGRGRMGMNYASKGIF
jgi:hypothetical protein